MTLSFKESQQNGNVGKCLTTSLWVEFGIYIYMCVYNLYIYMSLWVEFQRDPIINYLVKFTWFVDVHCL